MGAVAVKIHCPKYSYLQEELKRALTDIDYVSLGKYMSALPRFFSELGYQLNKEEAEYTILLGRYIFYSNKNPRLHVDIFFDKLEMCHTIDFTKRLEIDAPTISLADLMLEKLQIVEINEKDIKDVIIVLLEHDIGDEDKETINSKYIADSLSDDWGFYYTTTVNLKKVRAFLDQYKLSDDQRSEAKEKIDKLLDVIERRSKSFSWKMRARVGPKRKWYRDVGLVSHEAMQASSKDSP